MRLSLRTMVLAVFVLLVVSLCLQAVLSIATTVRSAQQVTALQRRGLVPAVGLAILSRNLAQEQGLLTTDMARLSPDRRGAVYDELMTLDASITSSARHDLLPVAFPQWRAAWASYVRLRTDYLQALRRGLSPRRASVLRLQLSDRLNAALDVVEGNMATQLTVGQDLYARAVASDWEAIRLAILGFLAALATGATLAAVITRRLAYGLGNLAATTRLITQGALEVRADESGRDEIATLAADFNHMTDALLSAERRADSDALTGLLNHRALVTALDRELERTHRYNRSCTVLFCDLDHFKALNDSCGHAAGDMALREFASVVRSALRSVDIVGRWGGEEFLAILPEADTAAALCVAERVRAAVAAHTFAASGGLHLTCSIGVAAYPTDATDRDHLAERADQAMYAAKRLGRNQVRAAGDPAVAALRTATDQSGSREEAALAGTVEALAALVEARDQYTGEHTQEVAGLAERVALALGLTPAQARMVGLAGCLHDVGKIGVPDAVLQKPGRLTEEEWVLMCRHPVVGADIVSRVPALRPVAPVIRAHHERWDGGGYPDGLAGEAIPLGARIVAVVDTYGAMTTDRPYRQARPPAMALAELQRCAGTQFDPSVVAALVGVLRLAPVGAGIRLAS